LLKARSTEEGNCRMGLTRTRKGTAPLPEKEKPSEGSVRAYLKAKRRRPRAGKKEV